MNTLLEQTHGYVRPSAIGHSEGSNDSLLTTEEHYEIYIAEMARRADATMILTHSDDNAAIVLAQILRMATESVKILSGCLHDKIFGNRRTINALKSLCQLKPFVKIQVLHEYLVHPDNQFLQMLRSVGGNQVEVRRLEKTVNTPVRFVVSDDQNFRFEPDGKNEAIVYFGDRHNACRISKIFDDLWIKSV